MEFREQINFYCDESCYLEHDKSKYMVLGMIFCPKSCYNQIKDRIFKLKNKYKINKSAETKWSKISKSRYLYYKELIEYFFEPTINIAFNGIVVDKKKLNHEEFKQSHNEFYYKIMYYMIDHKISAFDYNKIYIDEKDTHNAERVRTLEKILKSNYKYYFSNTIKPIQVIKSQESQLMQITDILTGAISYELNNKEKISESKKTIISLINEKIGYKINNKKNINTPKFELMFFKCKEHYHG